MDNIIESLSSQNDPHKLQTVARELLSLQKMITNSIAEHEDSRTSSQRSHLHSNSMNLRNEGTNSKATDLSTQSTKGLQGSSPYRYSASQFALTLNLFFLELESNQILMKIVLVWLA